MRRRVKLKKYLFSVSAVALICGDKLFVYTRSRRGEQLKGSSEALVEIKKEQREDFRLHSRAVTEREEHAEPAAAACF